MIAGQSYGFEVDGYSMDLDSLRNDMTYPCINDSRHKEVFSKHCKIGTAS